MHGNNEIGNINDLKSISKVCDQHNIVFHSDTVQTVGHYPINLNDINIHGIVGLLLSSLFSGGTIFTSPGFNALKFF